MVRDVIINCFFEAHCKDSGIIIGEGKDDEKTNRNYCREIVKKAFRESKGDFDNPTRAGITGAIQKLSEFAINFRDSEIIKKHAAEINILVEKMSD